MATLFDVKVKGKDKGFLIFEFRFSIGNWNRQNVARIVGFVGPGMTNWTERIDRWFVSNQSKDFELLN
jgi:hypothetical protein